MDPTRNELNNINNNNNNNQSLIRPIIKFNLLINDNNTVNKIFQFFRVIECPYLDEFSSVLMTFSKNGIKAKYGFSLNQDAIKHYGDLNKMQEIPYLIFDFKYNFFSQQANFEDNIIKKSYQEINLINRQVIQERLPVNHDILTLAVDKEDYCYFIKEIKNLNQKQDSSLNIKIKTEKDEKENKKNFLEFFTMMNGAVVTRLMPVTVHCLNEKYEMFPKNYRTRIRNFPTELFLNSAYRFVKNLEILEEEKNRKKILCWIKKVKKQNEDCCVMKMRSKTSFIEFRIRDIQIQDIEHLQNFFIFKKDFFLCFGRMLEKIKNKNEYVIDWEFLRCHTSVDNQQVDYNILNLNLRTIDKGADGDDNDFGVSNEQNNFFNNKGSDESKQKVNMNISSNIMYFQVGLEPEEFKNYIQEMD